MVYAHLVVSSMIHDKLHSIMKEAIHLCFSCRYVPGAGLNRQIYNLDTYSLIKTPAIATECFIRKLCLIPIHLELLGVQFTFNQYVFHLRS